jgi:hypothetical protein
MALPIYNLSVLDNVPRAASGAQVYVYTQPTTGITPPTFDGSIITPGSWSTAATPLATIYADNGGSVPLPNPFNLDGNGNGWFYAVSGVYTVVVTGGTLASPLILADQALLTTSAGGLTLQTNGSANSNQALLNLVQGSNITITNSGGNTTISGTATAITFKINGTNATSQVLQNLVAGSGITISDGGSGNITFASTGGLSLEVDGTPNTDQGLLNLKHGTHTTVVDDGSGGVTIDSAYPVFQANSVALTSSGTVNLQPGSGISITNPSAGNVLISSTASIDVNQLTATLTAAQILALNVTPIQLVPAPGAGFINVPIAVLFEFNEVGAAFAGVHTGYLVVYYNTTKSSNLSGDSTGLLDQTVQTFEQCTPGTTNIFSTSAQAVNQPIMLYNNAAAYTGGGTSTLDVTVLYTTYAVV